MSEGLYTLSESACIEPLVGRWHAWPHNLAPVPQSLHLVNYQLKVLQSYLGSPAQHEQACKSPRFLGGPFVNIPARESEKLRDLLETTLRTQQDSIDFAEALNGLGQALQQEANGESLEDRYEGLPAPLRGHVELIYDYFNHPIIRCLEGRLYKSRYYKPELQSLRLFDLLEDERPYYASTPRLKDAQSIDWEVAFADPSIDEFFRLDFEPAPREAIRELLGVPGRGNGALSPLLKESDEKADPKWRGEGVRIRYFGHACALFETKDVAILLDPLVAGVPRHAHVERFSYADLPRHIDFALISHGHHDHFVVETLLRLRRRIGALVVPKNSDAFYADFSLRLLGQHLGFKNVIEVDCYDEIPFEGGKITAAPFLGEHNNLPGAKSAYFIEAGGKSALFAADSNCLDTAIYDPIREAVGGVDALFVGMECIGAPLAWNYGPMLPLKPERRVNESRRSNACNAERALHLAQAVKCGRGFVYAVGREPWIKHILALNPSDSDPYMVEINKFVASAKATMQVDVKLLFGKSEIFL